MATIYDLDPDLRQLGRRIPADVMANLSPLEAQLRVEAASALIAEADLASDSRKGDRYRSKAGRMLQAMSPQALHAAMSILEGELRDAGLRGADREAYAIGQQIRDLERRNPQPSPERLVAAAQAAITRNRKLTIPPTPQNSIWGRRLHGPKRKKNQGR
jgi:hypothetical protein